MHRVPRLIHAPGAARETYTHSIGSIRHRQECLCHGKATRLRLLLGVQAFLPEHFERFSRVEPARRSGMSPHPN